MLSKNEFLSDQKDPKLLIGSPKPFLLEPAMLDLFQTMVSIQTCTDRLIQLFFLSLKV